MRKFIVWISIKGLFGITEVAGLAASQPAAHSSLYQVGLTNFTKPLSGGPNKPKQAISPAIIGQPNRL